MTIPIRDLSKLTLDHLYHLRDTLARGSQSRQQVEAEIARREEEIQTADFFGTEEELA